MKILLILKFILLIFLLKCTILEEDQVEVDQVVEAASLIAVVEDSVVDAAVQRNEEGVRQIPVDPLRGLVLINLLHSRPMAMLLKHPGKGIKRTVKKVKFFL